ncbi:hypothetical protein T09_9181 [Trichinella sp. T9]|nr:hypothetical protein T09_9181 [Trichinella sp. T9]
MVISAVANLCVWRRRCIKHRDLITMGRRFLPNANLRLGWSSSKWLKVFFNINFLINVKAFIFLLFKVVDQSLIEMFTKQSVPLNK